MTPNGTVGSTIQIKINGHKANFNGLLADQVGGAKLQMSGANAQTATLTNPNNSFTGGLFFDNGSVSVNSIGMIGNPTARPVRVATFCLAAVLAAAPWFTPGPATRRTA